LSAAEFDTPHARSVVRSDRYPTEALDAKATQAYRRLEELHADVAQATEWNDSERTARAHQEIDPSPSSSPAPTDSVAAPAPWPTRSSESARPPGRHARQPPPHQPGTRSARPPPHQRRAHRHLLLLFDVTDVEDDLAELELLGRLSRVPTVHWGGSEPPPKTRIPYRPS